MPVAQDIIAFDHFYLDRRRRTLVADGKPVPVQSKAFDILDFLISHRDKFVTRDEIEADVWQGQHMAPNNVAVQMSALRRALADFGGDKLIIGAAGRGYRFVGDVKVPQLTQPSRDNPALVPAPNPIPGPPIEPAGPQSPRRRLALAAAAVSILALLSAIAWKQFLNAPAAPPRLSIAVLPFRNLSTDRSQDYMADAITDDLTTDLAHVPASTVIARSSADSTKYETPQRIGHDLNVAYVLAGTLVPEDGQYHVTASLVDTATAANLWSSEFDTQRAKMSEIRENIVRHIVSPLHIALDQIESSRSLHDRPNNPDAQDLFLRARSQLDWDHSREGLELAQRQLELAIAKQPDFSDAQAELGWLLLRKIRTMDDPDEDADYGEAKKVIGDALRGSPLNPKAMAAHAREYEIDGKCPAAQPEAEHVLVIEPSNLDARTVLVACDLSELRFDDATTQYQNILRLDPDSPVSNSRYLALGMIQLVRGKYTDAIELLDRSREGETAPFDEMGPGEQAEFSLIAAEQLSGSSDRARADYKIYAQQFHGRTTWRISTYLPEKWLTLEGVRRMLKALNDAGMPEYADENEPAADAAQTCYGEDFAPTPLKLNGAVVINAATVAKELKEQPPPLFIDVGRGVSPISGSQVFDSTTTESKNGFAARVAGAGGGKARPVVVLADGSTGCSAYAAAQHLVEQGFVNVSWFRGGEEAWCKFQTSYSKAAQASMK